MIEGMDERVFSVLDDIAKWLKLAYGEAIRERLERVLDSEPKKRAYEATDGNATTRELGALVGVRQQTISKWWIEWTEAGLVEPGTDYKDRPKKLISLTYFKLL